MDVLLYLLEVLCVCLLYLLLVVSGCFVVFVGGVEWMFCFTCWRCSVYVLFFLLQVLSGCFMVFVGGVEWMFFVWRY